MFVKAIKALWIGLAVAVLFVTLYKFDGTPNSDIGDFFAWSMAALSWPSGLLAALLYVALSELFSINVVSSYSDFLISWVGIFALGYTQWFVLLPWLWKKAKRSFSKRKTCP